MAEEADEGGINRGPKGGKKHTPGRDHNKKSNDQKRRRFREKRRKRAIQRDDEARRQWKEWDELTDEQRRLLGPAHAPKMPRPKDEC